jgi:uncharacterized protein
MNKTKFILVFLIGFGVYYWCDATFFSQIKIRLLALTGVPAIAHIITYTITLIPLLLTLFVLHKSYRNIPEQLGLSRAFHVGLIFSFLCTLPMLISYGLKFKLATNLDVNTIIISTISSAVFEEIIFRGFLFGQLYRHTRLGFLPSVFFGSLLFGIGHLYQSNDVNKLVGIFAITFLGSIFFSWVYAEWKFNLWTAIFVHCLMNLYWLLFNVDENALGSTYVNIFRFAVLFIAILGTIFYKKKMKLPMEVGRRTWWLRT